MAHNTGERGVTESSEAEEDNENPGGSNNMNTMMISLFFQKILVYYSLGGAPKC